MRAFATTPPLHPLTADPHPPVNHSADGSLQGVNFNEMRSKTKCITTPVTSGDPKDFPDWSFDGSSTGQAEGNNSDCILRCAAPFFPHLRQRHLVQHPCPRQHGTQLVCRPAHGTASGHGCAAVTAESACRPVYVCPDPTRGGDSVIVLCMVMNPDGTPHETNHRQPLMDLLDDEILAEEPLYGFEQEYTMMAVRSCLWCQV